MPADPNRQAVLALNLARWMGYNAVQAYRAVDDVARRVQTDLIAAAAEPHIAVTDITDRQLAKLQPLYARAAKPVGAALDRLNGVINAGVSDGAAATNAVAQRISDDLANSINNLGGS